MDIFSVGSAFYSFLSKSFRLQKNIAITIEEMIANNTRDISYVPIDSNLRNAILLTYSLQTFNETINLRFRVRFRNADEKIVFAVRVIFRQRESADDFFFGAEVF